jgi:hypothetical protein
MAMNIVDAELGLWEASFGGTNAQEFHIRRTGWYKMRLNCNASGTGIFPVIIRSVKYGVYGYKIRAEELSILNGQAYNAATDTTDKVFFIKNTTGQIAFDVPASVLPYLHHFLYLESGDRVNLELSAVINEFDYLGPHRPFTAVAS